VTDAFPVRPALNKGAWQQKHLDEAIELLEQNRTLGLK
jgi:hypothetical protein